MEGEEEEEEEEERLERFHHSAWKVKQSCEERWFQKKAGLSSHTDPPTDPKHVGFRIPRQEGWGGGW